MAEAKALIMAQSPAIALSTVDTPGQHSIEQVSSFLSVSPEKIVKTLLVKGSGGGVVALLLRGDHALNPVKASKIEAVANPFEFASEAEVLKAAGCAPGSLGPCGLEIPIIADLSVGSLTNFTCGANQNGRHFQGVNFGRDLPLPEMKDLRLVTEGDASPDGLGSLRIARGIEVGHIFQLGTK